jgi:hypothetical protein
VETVAAQPPRMVEDSIASFERSGAESATEDISTTPQASVAAEEAGNTERITDNGLDCECGITVI